MKLEKCPFCGGEAIVVKTESCGRYIGCWDCGGRTEEFETDYAGSAHDKAIAAWNRRADLGSCENELIVRCESCKHYNRIGCSDGFGWCENMDRGTHDEFYCASGKRLEEAK